MTKNELVNRLKDVSIIFSRQDVEYFLTNFTAVLKDAAIAGDDVPLVGFGRFTALDVKEKSGRNPKTGEALTIAAHRTVKFKLSPSMKEALKK